MTAREARVAYNAMNKYEVTFIRVQDFGKFQEDDIGSNLISPRPRLRFVTTFLDFLSKKPSVKASEVVSHFFELHQHLLSV
jgi:hypothetical protein